MSPICLIWDLSQIRSTRLMNKLRTISYCNSRFLSAWPCSLIPAWFYSTNKYTWFICVGCKKLSQVTSYVWQACLFCFVLLICPRNKVIYRVRLLMERLESTAARYLFFVYNYKFFTTQGLRVKYKLQQNSRIRKRVTVFLHFLLGFYIL
jgi:hypothetical protein